MEYKEILFSANTTTLDPLFYGQQACEPNHEWGPGVRLYWLIHYVVSGKGIFRIRGKEYAVTAGSLFVVPPYEQVMYRADSEEPWEYMWVGFRVGGELPLKLEPVIHCPEAYNIFRAMPDSQRLSGGTKAYSTGLLWQFFALLLDAHNPHGDAVDLALNYIHSKYMYPLTVEDIAHTAGLERSYFTTLFTRQIGISPGKYLLNHRMEIAAALLTRDNCSVSTTALSVGYPDVYTFSKTFKRHFGLSPREYAKQNT